MGISIALYGLKLINKETGKQVDIINQKINLYQGTVLEALYQKFNQDYEKKEIKELGKPALNIYSKYCVDNLKRLKDNSFFGKIKYGKNLETPISILKENETENLKPNEVPAYIFHFYFAPFSLSLKREKENYILLLIQMTDGSGIKSDIIDGVYKKIIQDILDSNTSEKFKLNIDSFNYGNLSELIEKSTVKKITVYKKIDRNNRVLNELSKALDFEVIDVHQTLNIRKLNKKLKNFSDKIYKINLEDLGIESLNAEVLLGNKKKSIRLNNKEERIETKQTRIDITEEYKSCEDDFEKIMNIFLKEYEDIKEWSNKDG
ncbi:hypothetical protein [uncultured Leptotrichia sp.]|uniref:hypothetical protein n=1 Tax=uncultured Leptotrichia sp. TaxID=159271 RepID=UPI002630B6E2|nr:hypothetical protein [uncultured Leptotrichia sp.]